MADIRSRQFDLRSLAPILAAVVMAGCAAATPRAGLPTGEENPPVDFYVEPLHSTAKLDPAATVHIVNRWGDIQVRSATEAGSVQVDAAVQRIGESPPARPTFAISEDSGRFDLEVQYPAAALEPRTGRVDLAVYVPDGMHVDLETLDGGIEVKKTSLDLKARTQSGDVFFINQGDVDVETDSGNVVARPTRPGWGALRLYSYRGKITALLPAGQGLEVVARGTGDIHSDWPLESQGPNHLLAFGVQDEKRDTVLITSGGSIELLEVVLRPELGETQTRP